jgi:hypothetical protein
MNDIQGKLVFDSWNDSVPDLRGSATGERHLIYEGGGVLLDLLLRPANNAGNADKSACLQIGGQVMPTDDMSQSVSHVPVLLENGASCSRTHTNALGEFSFQHAPPNGCFDISIVFGSHRFVVRGLDSNQPRNWQVLDSGNDRKTARGETR